MEMEQGEGRKEYEEERSRQSTAKNYQRRGIIPDAVAWQQVLGRVLKAAKANKEPEAKAEMLSSTS